MRDAVGHEDAVIGCELVANVKCSVGIVDDLVRLDDEHQRDDACGGLCDDETFADRLDATRAPVDEWAAVAEIFRTRGRISRRASQSLASGERSFASVFTSMSSVSAACAFVAPSFSYAYAA